MTDMDARLRLDRVVKAYDVRGVVPGELGPQIAQALGAAFAQSVVAPAMAPASPRVVVARDMRESGPQLVEAFVRGAIQAGADVLDAGQCSTDELYFASGLNQAAGAMFTASHNPARYNGVKLCLPGARPVGQETGLRAVRDRAAQLLAGADAEGPRVGAVPEVQSPRATVTDVQSPRIGTVTEVDVLVDYARRLRSLVDLTSGRHLRVVVDAGNGMAGLTVPAALGPACGLDPLPIELIPLYFELDGSFPNHEANPLEPANTIDLQQAVRRHRADIGLAFDGDADRCFVIDERGERVDPSTVTTLVGLREAAHERAIGGEPVVLHNVITSRAVPEILGANGVRTVRTRVGHSFIKAQMAEQGAVFGGEHSGHFYFRDFFRADSGLLAAMHVMAALAEQPEPLSRILADIDPYVRSGEINTPVDDVAAAQNRVLAVLADDAGADGSALEVDRLDGLTISQWADERWWLNLRPSNTEPLLRLNVEAADEPTMRRVRDRVSEVLSASDDTSEA